MATPKPFALYPTYAELKDVCLDEFPDLSLHLTTSESCKRTAWIWGQEFGLVDEIEQNVA